jgi:oligopeptide/dipeptide ABC transporter ATP-binding protein
VRETVFEVRGLDVTVRGTRIVRELSYEVRAGELLAVVGESGAGKSMSVLGALGLAPPEASVTGTARLRGREAAGLRGRGIGLMTQDGPAALSPVSTVGGQLATVIRSVRGVGRSEARKLAVAGLEQVGIADAARRARAHPHEFSGGMRQRAALAMALAGEPEVLFADEPTAGLDMTVQAQVLETLDGLRGELGLAIVLITHDLGLVAALADRVLVMYAGRQVECGPSGRVFADPAMPYTAGLLASRPTEARLGRRLPVIRGNPPSPEALPEGCAFAPRCPLAAPVCAAEPPLSEVSDGHRAACHMRHIDPKM